MIEIPPYGDPIPFDTPVGTLNYIYRNHHTPMLRRLNLHNRNQFTYLPIHISRLPFCFRLLAITNCPVCGAFTSFTPHPLYEQCNHCHTPIPNQRLSHAISGTLKPRDLDIILLSKDRLNSDPTFHVQKFTRGNAFHTVSF